MIPDSPADLIKYHTEARAREYFDSFDQFSPVMQQQAQLLTNIGMSGELSDLAFREIITVSIAFWRDCNQARFHEQTGEGGDLKECFRSAQIDQFLNTSLVALQGLPQLSDDRFECEQELDGS